MASWEYAVGERWTGDSKGKGWFVKIFSPVERNFNNTTEMLNYMGDKGGSWYLSLPG